LSKVNLLTERRIVLIYKLRIQPLSLSLTCLKDFYETLELTPQASSKEIKDAYYKLSKKYHPDTNQGNQEATKKFQVFNFFS